MGGGKYLICAIDDEHWVGFDCSKCWNRRCFENPKRYKYLHVGGERIRHEFLKRLAVRGGESFGK